MLRETQTTTKLTRLRKNKSSLGELSLEMALPFKRKNVLLNQQHLEKLKKKKKKKLLRDFQNTKHIHSQKKNKLHVFAYKNKFKFSKLQMKETTIKQRGWG